MTRLLHLIPRAAGLAGLIACCALAASATSHLLEATYLGESSDAAPVRPHGPPRSTRPSSAPEHDKDGAAVAARNMFCSTCQPDQPGPPEPAPADGDEIPMTSLPLDLLATNLTEPANASFATVRDRDSDRQGSFFVGDAIPGAGAIEVIRGAQVIFLNPQSGRRERLTLFPPAAARSAPESQRSRPRRDAQASATPFAESIAKVDDTTYEVERTLVDQLISNPAQLGASVRPTVSKDGAVGMKVFGVRPSSALAAIGVQSGDTIQSINGMAMTTSPDKLLEMYTKLSQQQSLSVTLERRGQSVTMNYRVR